MTGALEKELNTYFKKLNADQKRSVLQYVKDIFVKKEENSITIEQYNQELDEAEAAMDRGEFYTNEEVFAYTQKLLDAKKKG